MKGLFAILGGLGAGAAIMYLFDPNDGTRRRSVMRDKATSLGVKTQDAARGRMRDISNRAKGLLHESKSAFSGSSRERETNHSSFRSESFGDQGTFNH